jgi:hypothetical protein
MAWGFLPNFADCVLVNFHRTSGMRISDDRYSRERARMELKSLDRYCTDRDLAAAELAEIALTLVARDFRFHRGARGNIFLRGDVKAE